MPVTDGWFVVSILDAAWVTNEARGDACIFEGDEASFPEVGFTLAVLQPGQSGGRYHREANQEDFLVLSGECLLLIEGEERALAAAERAAQPVSQSLDSPRARGEARRLRLRPRARE